MPARLLPYAVLAVLGLLFFGDLVLHPGQVLYSDSSDVLAEHLPAKRFLVRALRQDGELPLWCPHSFAGAPFVHDIQVEAFYPFLVSNAGREWRIPDDAWLYVVGELLLGLQAVAPAR